MCKIHIQNYYYNINIILQRRTTVPVNTGPKSSREPEVQRINRYRMNDYYYLLNTQKRLTSSLSKFIQKLILNEFILNPMTQSRNDEERNSFAPDSGFKRNYTYIHIYFIEYPIALNAHEQ